MPTMFKQKDRPDLEDARALVMTYLEEPERIQHPLWTLLVFQLWSERFGV